MAVGLGMTLEEWKDLRNQVDDSFWVMRVIGSPLFLACTTIIFAAYDLI